MKYEMNEIASILPCMYVNLLFLKSNMENHKLQITTILRVFASC